MKKFISMAMTLSLITVMLTSCGGKGTSKPKKEKETTTAASVVVQDDTTTTTSNTNYEPLTALTSQSSSAIQTTYRTSSSTSYSTKYTQKTTQKTTKKSTAPATASNAYQISPSLVPHVIGNVTKAWKLNQGGANITISRIEYGNRVTQYFSSNINKNIVNPKSVSYQPTCSVAVIEVGSATKLNVSKGNPSNQTTTEALAKGVNAVIAINGQTTNYEENKGAVIRGGSIYRNYTGAEKDARERLVMHKDGSWSFVKLNNENTKNEVEKGGAYNSIRYQKIMIRNGQVLTAGNDPDHRNYAYLGRINNKKYVMMVTEFMPALDAAAVLKAYGCTDAVRVQGGNCTQMYVRGIGNTTGSNGASIKGLNKVGMLETEWFAKNGLLESGKGGGPCTNEFEVIYF